MKVMIKSIEGNRVEFESPYGSAIGIWEDAILADKKEFSVELDIKEVIKYDDIKLSRINEPKIELNSNGVLICGMLVEYNADGYAVLKLGDSLIAIETVFNEAFPPMCGCYILLVVSQIYLYDEHLF